MHNLIIKKKAKRAVLSALSAELVFDDLRDIQKKRVKDIALEIIKYENNKNLLIKEIDKYLEKIFIKAGGQTEIIEKLDPKIKREFVDKLKEVINYV